MDEPYIAYLPWGYVLSWTAPLDKLSWQRINEYVIVTRCYTTKALHCHACDCSGRKPCSHIRLVVAHVHQKKGA